MVGESERDYRNSKISKTLSKNSIILLGSLVETFWVNRGDKVQINISGMGSVSVKFE